VPSQGLAATASSGASPPWSKYDSLIAAHAALATSAFLIMAPAAILLARFGRHLSSWLRAHRAINGFMALIAVVGIALGIAAVNNVDDKHFASTHQQVGLVLLVLLGIQISLGILAHHLFNPDRVRRPIQNIAHLLLGILLVALGFFNIVAGISWWHVAGSRSTPTAVKAIIYVLMAAIVCAYLAGLVLLVRDRRRASHSWGHAVAGLGRRSKADTVDKAPALAVPLHRMGSDEPLRRAELGKAPAPARASDPMAGGPQAH
jgi:hypothetical protein